MDYSSATLSTYNDFEGLASLRAQAQKDQSKAVDRVAEQFEGMFLNIMIKEMRKTVPESEFFNTPAINLFQEMQDQQVAMDMAKEGPLGFAKFLKANIQLQSSKPGEQKQEGFEISRDQKVFELKEQGKSYALPISKNKSFVINKYQAIEKVN
jgi:Rod binding domain-containing protein